MIEFEIIDDISDEYLIEYCLDLDIDNYFQEEETSTEETPLCDAFLNNRGYDENTKTIEFDKNRVRIGKISPKAKQNLEKFLRNHKYDKKDDTVLLDVPNENNKKQRVRLEIMTGNKSRDLNASTYFSKDTDSIATYDCIKIAIGKGILEKGNILELETIFGHEQGHVDIKNKTTKFLKDINKVWKSVNIVYRQLNTLVDKKFKELKETDKRIKYDKVKEMIYADEANKRLVEKYNKLFNKLKNMLKIVSDITGESYDIEPTLDVDTALKLGIKSSEWKRFLKSNDVKRKLEEDVKKTFPEYKEAVDFIKKHPLSFLLAHPHDKNPEEYYADRKGLELAVKYKDLDVDEVDYNRQMRNLANIMKKYMSSITIKDLKDANVDEFLIGIIKGACNKRFKIYFSEFIKDIHKNKISNGDKKVLYNIYMYKCFIKLKKKNMMGYIPFDAAEITYTEMEKYIRKHFLSLKIDYYKGIKSSDTYADKYVDWCERVLTDSIKKLNKNIVINVCGYTGRGRTRYPRNLASAHHVQSKQF